MRQARLSRNRRILALLGGGVVLSICCVCIALIGWIEIDDRLDPAGATALRATFTAEAAVEQATEAAASAQATADIARIENKQLIFEEDFESGSPAMETHCFDSVENGEASARFSTHTTCVAFTGHTVSDFVAQVQCDVTGRRGQCGIAFAGVGNTPDKVGSYYAVSVTDEVCLFTRIPPDGFSHFGNFKCDSWSWIDGITQTIRVERVRHHLRIFLGDDLQDEFDINEPDMLTGDIGILMGRGDVDDGPASVYIDVDNFKIWEVP